MLMDGINTHTKALFTSLGSQSNQYLRKMDSARIAVKKKLLQQHAGLQMLLNQVTCRVSCSNYIYNLTAPLMYPPPPTPSHPQVFPFFSSTVRAPSVPSFFFSRALVLSCFPHITIDKTNILTVYFRVVLLRSHNH